MRNLEAIDRNLAEAREALSCVEGTPTEVYSRIVGYYRSVRNWNKGKREEYGERKLYRIDTGKMQTELTASPFLSSPEEAKINSFPENSDTAKHGEERLLLFIRASCPKCPAAKTAAGKLGIPVELVNTDTVYGMGEAALHNVMSTPTAILYNSEGREIDRARDSRSIAALSSRVEVC